MSNETTTTTGSSSPAALSTLHDDNCAFVNCIVGWVGIRLTIASPSGIVADARNNNNNNDNNSNNNPIPKNSRNQFAGSLYTSIYLCGNRFAKLIRIFYFFLWFHAPTHTSEPYLTKSQPRHQGPPPPPPSSRGQA